MGRFGTFAVDIIYFKKASYTLTVEFGYVC